MTGRPVGAWECAQGQQGVGGERKASHQWGGAGGGLRESPNMGCGGRWQQWQGQLTYLGDSPRFWAFRNTVLPALYTGANGDTERLNTRPEVTQLRKAELGRKRARRRKGRPNGDGSQGAARSPARTMARGGLPLPPPPRRAHGPRSRATKQPHPEQADTGQDGRVVRRPPRSPR